MCLLLSTFVFSQSEHYNFTNIPESKYALEIYKTGYRSNDAYATYLSIGSPSRLNKQQVDQIKKQNNGSPVASEIITVKRGITFSKELDLRKMIFTF